MCIANAAIVNQVCAGSRCNALTFVASVLLRGARYPSSWQAEPLYWAAFVPKQSLLAQASHWNGVQRPILGGSQNEALATILVCAFASLPI